MTKSEVLEKCKQILEKYNLKTPYFFSISSLNPRKNFRHTIKCFIDFIEKNNLTDVSLVLAGPDGWGELFDGINLEKHKKQIIFTGFVDEEDLPYLYKNAIASIYLSLYEGFGLPPLESIKTGTPVIASNVSSIPEVVPAECGGLLINPKDENALICMLQKLYFDENFRQEISIKGVEYAKTYTWEKFAQVLKKEFE